MLFLSLTFLLASLATDTTGTAVVSDTTEAWQHAVNVRLGGSQVGFQNWNEGGLNALSAFAGFEVNSKRRQEHILTKYDVRLRIGLVKQDTLDVRKSEDILLATGSHQLVGDAEGPFATLQPIIAYGIRTQFAPGFNFKRNPYDDGRPLPVRVSGFFAPAELTQSLGLTYDPNSWYTQRLGLGSKITVVSERRYRPLYAMRPNQPIRFEVGIESVSEMNKEVVENVTYKGTLRLFASFNRPDTPDLLMENFINMKVNEWLSVTGELVLLYDRDQRAELQMRQSLSVGIAYRII
ncbi:MAG: DUF3078 domain-containing protein [Bacteroidota bacterium]